MGEKIENKRTFYRILYRGGGVQLAGNCLARIYALDNGGNGRCLLLSYLCRVYAFSQYAAVWKMSLGCRSDNGNRICGGLYRQQRIAYAGVGLFQSADESLRTDLFALFIALVCIVHPCDLFVLRYQKNHVLERGCNSPCFERMSQPLLRFLSNRYVIFVIANHRYNCRAGRNPAFVFAVAQWFLQCESATNVLQNPHRTNISIFHRDTDGIPV